MTNEQRMVNYYQSLEQLSRAASASAIGSVLSLRIGETEVEGNLIAARDLVEQSRLMLQEKEHHYNRAKVLEE